MINVLMDKIKNSKKSNLFKWLMLTALAVLLIAFSLYYFYFKDRNASQLSEDGINYSPATKEDRSYNNQIKENLGEEPENNQSADAEKALVEPVITAWGQPDGPGTAFKVNGYIPGIIESDGLCEIKLTSENGQASVSKATLVNAQSTSCGQLIIPYSQLQPGTWQAVLSYSSPTSAGKSKTQEIEIK